MQKVLFKKHIMELTIYNSNYDTSESIQNFMDFYYSLQMKHLASDFLNKGLSPKQISEAVTMAIKIANSSNIDTHKHFKPVYSAIDQEIIKDCKLSHLGYGLVLMNADKNLPAVSEFQMDILNNFLKVS